MLDLLLTIVFDRAVDFGAPDVRATLDLLEFKLIDFSTFAVPGFFVSARALPL